MTFSCILWQGKLATFGTCAATLLAAGQAQATAPQEIAEVCNWQSLETCCLLSDSKVHSRPETPAAEYPSPCQGQAQSVAIASMRPAGRSAKQSEASSLASSCALACPTVKKSQYSLLCPALPLPWASRPLLYRNLSTGCAPACSWQLAATTVF